MNKDNQQMTDLMNHLETASINIGRINQNARYDKDETDGTFSVLENQLNQFFYCLDNLIKSVEEIKIIRDVYLIQKGMKDMHQPYVQFDLLPEYANRGHCHGVCTECPQEDHICRYIGGTPGQPDSQTDPDGCCYKEGAQVV